jgi:hypothetical protein
MNTFSDRHRSFSLLPALALLGLGLVALPACSSGGPSNRPPVLGAISDIGLPKFTIENEATIPVQVTVWTTRRTTDYEQTWRDMNGRTETVEVGGEVQFVLRELENDPRGLVRVELRTRGVSWEPSRTHWFEALGRNTLRARITGDADDLSLQSQRGTFASIPAERVLRDVIETGDRPRADVSTEDTDAR